ncbi:MAG: MASE3 domain-containing protein [Geobacteraceae bacterium]|nr:MASE3 domain-containing protein [Geobacteraceae bacterium]
MFSVRQKFSKTTIILWLAALTALLFSGRVNFPFFHIIAELFSIIVAVGICIISWHSRRLHENGFFIFLGVSALSVAVIDLLHTLTYKGVAVMPQSGSPLATQLWIAGRFLQAISMLLAFYFLHRRLRDTTLVASFFAITTLMITAIFVWKIFPACYIEGIGLTQFKIVGEYLIISLFAAALFLLRQEWKSFDPHVARYLAISLGCFMASELSFTNYVSVFGLANQIGHILKIVGFYCLYRGVVVISLTQPYDLLFRKLKEINRTLEKRVQEEVARNREKDSLLVQKDRQAAMGEMTGNIAHQWRQPLNAVSLIVQDLAMQNNSGTLDKESLRDSFAKIIDLTRHLSQTITDFRDLYQTDKERVAFSLREKIRQSLKLMEGTLREHCISVKVSAGEEILALGFPNQFAQVVLNLLNNSRDALTERKVPNPTIWIEVSHDRMSSLVTIRDNAGGIPNDIIHRVFDPYFTTKEEGTGIGLYMSRNIIEQNMSGRLTVRNDEEGAVFCLELCPVG